jgi:mRNA interferase RelE/StbE
MWKLEISSSSRQFLRALDQKSRTQIAKALERFVFEINNPDQPKMSDIKTLKGKKGEFRLRVGDFRIRFTKDKNVLLIIVIRIGYRKDIYQD